MKDLKMTITNTLAGLDSPILELNSKEAPYEVAVNVNIIKTFTDNHVQILDELRSKSAHPRIYGSLAPKGIKYIHTKRVPIDIIDSDNPDFVQTARVGVNPKLGSIEGDIRANGWSLTELPIMVMEKGDGTYVILEGRTRYFILMAMGMTNIIVDVFKNTSKANALRFAVAQNDQKKPYGAASFKDVKRAVLDLMQYGEIPRDAPNFADLVLEEIRNMSTKLRPNEVNEIINDAENARYGELRVRSFPQGRGADKWIRDHNCMDSTSYMYQAVGTFEEKVIRSIIRKANSGEIPESIKEYRLVIHGGTLDSKDPAEAWIAHVLGFKNKFETFLTQISNQFFNGAPIDMGRIKIYGCIPMVKALEEDYPMDEIVLSD
jgi:hypothetical protein